MFHVILPNRRMAHHAQLFCTCKHMSLNGQIKARVDSLLTRRVMVCEASTKTEVKATATTVRVAREKNIVGLFNVRKDKQNAL